MHRKSKNVEQTKKKSSIKHHSWRKSLKETNPSNLSSITNEDKVQAFTETYNYTQSEQIHAEWENRTNSTFGDCNIIDSLTDQIEEFRKKKRGRPKKPRIYESHEQSFDQAKQFTSKHSTYIRVKNNSRACSTRELRMIANSVSNAYDERTRMHSGRRKVGRPKKNSCLVGHYADREKNGTLQITLKVPSIPEIWANALCDERSKSVKHCDEMHSGNAEGFDDFAQIAKANFIERQTVSKKMINEKRGRGRCFNFSKIYALDSFQMSRTASEKT
jgi:hypothetical protein